MNINMDYRRFGNTLVVRFDKGEEICAQLKEVAIKENIKLASIQALGAVDKFTIGAFDTVEKQYHANHFSGIYEIVSLTGTISTMNGDYYSHLHMSAGDEKGHVVGGHLNEAFVSATCELIITVIDGVVDRAFSEEIGLNLFKFM